MSPGFGRVIICTPSTSSAVTQVVSKADTTTSLASSVNPTRFGQSTSFTATVSVVAPGTTLVAYPSGTVNFFDRSAEHTSELQSRSALVCRLLLDNYSLSV